MTNDLVSAQLCFEEQRKAIAQAEKHLDALGNAKCGANAATYLAAVARCYEEAIDHGEMARDCIQHWFEDAAPSR